MRNNYWLFIILLLIGNNFSIAQDVIDPYRIRAFSATPVNAPKVVYNNDPAKIVYDTDDDIRYVNGGYTGEYMISLRHLHWDNDWSEFPASSGNPFPLTPWVTLGNSYKMEVVSFPFTPNCYNDAIGCTHDPNNPLSQPEYERKLYIPEDSYDPITESWGSIKNIRTDGRFTGAGGISGAGPTFGGDGTPENLVSDAFHHSSAVNNGSRHLLPHSVIKHTVYFHCGPDPATSDAVDSIVWVYDNTRGRMRFYPFHDSNEYLTAVSGSPTKWDVVFTPELISRPYSVDPGNVDFYYNEIGNNDWFDGGTIDYHGFKDGTSSPCNPLGYFPSSPALKFTESSFNATTVRDQFKFLNSGSPAPYSLYTTYLHNNLAKGLVGYMSVPPNIIIPANYQGVKHQYFIDRGYPFFNLAVINATDKIIYNPSEVTVVADVVTAGLTNVVFPGGYTFKTILGRYPSVNEVNDANTAANGGPYGDFRDVPVPVNAYDLIPVGGNQDDYPELSWDDPTTTDPAGFLNDERYGYYYIDDKAQITVEECVRIFDARFQVRPGGTLWFNDHSQVIGYEHTSNNTSGRFTIQGTGGAILRNNSINQYVQNGIITQTQPLHYIALNNIYAGTAVDPDANALTGDYDIEAGANVIFEAHDVVYLKDGFRAKQGSAFRAKSNGSLSQPAECWIQAGSGNRFIHTQPSEKQSLQTLGSNLIVSPNPGSGLFMASVKNQTGEFYFQINDIYGRTLFQKNETTNTASFDLSNQPQGIYIATVRSGGRQWTEKIVKE